MHLQNKTALITGASRGIGRAIAEKFAACGANIALVFAGNEAAAQEALQAIRHHGVEAKAYRCNVADFEATGRLVAQVLEDFGGVDILVNNAGIVRDALVLSMSEEDFDAVIGVNLKGAFNTIRHLYQHFMRKRRGRILNITSVVGLSGNAGQANYAAAKAGLIGLTKSTARELASRGITCNAIAPGYVESDMTGTLSDTVKQKALACIPAGRMASPGEIAELAAFLAGDAAAYITGEVVRIDGGMCM